MRPGLLLGVPNGFFFDRLFGGRADGLAGRLEPRELA